MVIGFKIKLGLKLNRIKPGNLETWKKTWKETWNETWKNRRENVHGKKSG